MTRFAAATVIAIALFASCSGDGPTTPTPSAVSTPTPTLDPPEESLDIEVTDGEVTGGTKRAKVELGETIGIAVRSDVKDLLSIEGDDKTYEVSAGGGIYVPFTADEVGTYEVRLEVTGITIAEIEVT